VVETAGLVAHPDQPVIAGGALLVEEGRVAAVGVPDDFAEAEHRVDLREHTVVPGMVDTHVHVEFDPDDDDLVVIARYGADRADDQLAARAVVNLRLLLASGVTTVRDCASSSALLRLRDRLDDGSMATAAPRILACGRPLTTTAGHLAWVGTACDSQDAIRAAVRQVMAEGADAIKVVTSGGTMTAGSNPHNPQFTTEELAIIVGEAHRLGRRVVGHALNNRAIASCVEAGVDSIDHARWSNADGSDGFSEEMAARIVAEQVNIGMTGSGWTRKLLGGSEHELYSAFRNHRRLFELGADLTLHTDAGSTETSFDGIVDSMRVMVAGLGASAADAFRAVTARAGLALGLDDVGHLTPGARADFLCLRADPREDLAVLDDIHAIHRFGVALVEDGKFRS
jgi:imidazolonepropionase-like amidohydrolase